MTSEEFDKIVDERLSAVKAMLCKKRKEYASGNKDRFHNFLRASRILGGGAMHALVGMWVKHIVSILDIVDDYGVEAMPSFEMINEKITDNIAYLILLEGMMKEDLKWVLYKPSVDIGEAVQSVAAKKPGRPKKARK
jgi:hypothetical protein